MADNQGMAMHTPRVTTPSSGVELPLTLRRPGARATRPLMGWSRTAGPKPSDYRQGDHVTASVPKTLMQTWHMPLTDIPAKVAARIKLCSPGFLYRYFDDAACHKYLETHYSSAHAAVFDDLRCGAHKADFFRYCYLYREGGVYIDIDLEPLETIPNILRGLEPGTMVTSLEHSGRGIFQAFVATPPNHHVFRELISEFFRPLVKKGRHEYSHFTHHMGAVLCRRKGDLLRPGTQRLVDGSRLWLMQESWIRKRGAHYVVHRGRGVFRSRYEGYEGSDVDAGASCFEN